MLGEVSIDATEVFGGPAEYVLICFKELDDVVPMRIESSGLFSFSFTLSIASSGDALVLYVASLSDDCCC